MSLPKQLKCTPIPVVKSVSLTDAVMFPVDLTTFIVSSTDGIVVTVEVRDFAITSFLISVSCSTTVPQVVEPVLSTRVSPTLKSLSFPRPESGLYSL